MRACLVILATLLFSGSVQAQESVQLRAVPHIRYFLDRQEKKELFLVSWFPTNIMSGIPDNRNVFIGIGYASKKWSIENMVWRQWSDAGNSISLNWRFMSKPTNRLSLYMEGGPRLDKKGFYEFVSIDVQVIGPLNIGVETENTHRVGQDTLGIGPRLSIPLPFTFLKAKPLIAVSRQERTLGPNVTRMYTILNWAF